MSAFVHAPHRPHPEPPDEAAAERRARRRRAAVASRPMSFHDLVRSWTEERLLFLDKVGSGRIRYLQLVNDVDNDVVDEIPSFRLREQSAELLRHVHDFAACAVDNALYVSGGFSVPRMAHLSRMLRFDPVAQSWSERQPMERARCKHAMVPYGACMLVAGGETSQGKITSACEIYDPALDKWTAFPRLPAPRCWLACAADGDDVYVSGGYLGGRGKDDFWKYDGATGEWADVGDRHSARLPLRLDRHCTVVIGKYIYTFGGVGYAAVQPAGEGRSAGKATKFETQTATYCLNLRTLSSEDGESPAGDNGVDDSPKGDEDEGGGIGGKEDADVVVDGEDDSSSPGGEPIADVRKMPPQSAKWIRLTDMSYARHSAGHIMLGDKLLVCGGTNAEFKCDVQPNELYDPVAAEWADEASLAAGDIGSLTCSRLVYTHTEIIQRALPSTWPLW